LRLWRVVCSLQSSRPLAVLQTSNFKHQTTNKRQQPLRSRGSLLLLLNSQFPGVLVGPPHVRKCHQMSSKEHIQLGWVVRWVRSTPPGHPAARRCVRVVPVLPLLLCTRSARARPSVGGQSPTPAPRQLPWSPPRAWCSCRLAALSKPAVTRICISCSLRQIEIETAVVPRSPRHRQRIPCGTKE
jgi:hypothetical protein